MRRDWSHLFPLISILLFCSTLLYGQAWSGVVASSRAIDWSTAGLPATLPDGETTSNPWTPPTRTQCTTSACNTVSSGTVTTSSIASAVASAPQGTYVLIPAGTYTASISLTSSNVTVRGSGAGSTFLTGTIAIGPAMNYGSAASLTASPAQGATSITVSGTPPSSGFAILEECDDGYTAASAAFTHYGSGTVCTGTASDPLGPWVCGYNTACDENGGSNANPHTEEEVVWITGVSGSTVTISSPLSMYNWKTSRSAALMWFSSTGVSGAGVEDLSLAVSNSDAVAFGGTYACWLKGVRIMSTSSSFPVITFSPDNHSLMANSYVGSTNGGTGSQLLNFGSDSGESGQSNFLFINNIIEGGWAEGTGASVNLVFAYNWWWNSGSTFTEAGEFEHHPGTAFVLREGEEAARLMDDDTWGTHNFNTWFRNWVTCYDPPNGTGGPAIDVGGWARFENVIGNVLGQTSSTCTTYAVLLRVNGPSGYPTDNSGLTQASLMTWGNYALCSGDPHCDTVTFNSSEVPSNLSSFGSNATPFENPVPANDDLPASFFINSMGFYPNGGTGLSWWKVCTSWTTFPTACASYTTPPMPPFGPTSTGGNPGFANMGGYASNNPAYLAWANLPLDSNYTNSLHQFDERVYQSDTAGVSAPSPPTGLTAVVQ